MLRSIKDILNYQTTALDGKMGKVADCLFGDRHWRVRYFALKTTSGFHLNLRYLAEEEDPLRHPIVLVSPENLEKPELGSMGKRLPVHLTKEEVEHCPSVNADLPMETRLMREFSAYLRHDPYGDRPVLWDPVKMPDYLPPESNYDHAAEEVEEHAKRVEEISKLHMHSAKEVLGYKVKGTDGELGSVADFILDDQNWTLRHVIVETGHWPMGRKHIVSMKKIVGFDWSNRRIEIALSAAEIESTPRFDPHTPVNRDQEKRRYDYYGSPCKSKAEMAES